MMRKIILLAFLILLLSANVDARVFTFEDLWTTEHQPIPDGYDYSSVSGDTFTFNHHGYTPSDIDCYWGGIDRLRRHSWGGYFDWWGMDNFPCNPVPIPPTILLLGSGLIGFVGLRKRFRKN